MVRSTVAHVDLAALQHNFGIGGAAVVTMYTNDGARRAKRVSFSRRVWRAA